MLILDIACPFHALSDSKRVTQIAAVGCYRVGVAAPEEKELGGRQVCQLAGL